MALPPSDPVEAAVRGDWTLYVGTDVVEEVPRTVGALDVRDGAERWPFEPPPGRAPTARGRPTSPTTGR